LVAGLGFLLAFWIWGRKVYRLSWLVVGGFPLMGFLLSLFFGDRVYGFDRVPYFLLAAGALMVLDGARTLLRYLCANPHPTQS
jgi:hypothetical protein